MTLLDAAHVRQLCILKQTQPQDDLKSRGNQIKPQMRHVRQLCILRPNGETNLNLKYDALQHSVRYRYKLVM
jgi:hypothetical protein